MKKELRSAFNTRQYMLSTDFEIYYYSDLHFKSVPPHVHSYYEFYFYLEGDASIEIEGEVFPLREGLIFLLPPGVRHRNIVPVNSDIPYRRFVLWVSRGLTEKLSRRSPDLTAMMREADKGRYCFRCAGSGFSLIQSKILRLLEEIHGSRFGRDACIQLCVDDLLLTMNRTVWEEDHPAEGGEEKDLFQNLTGYIEAHLDEDLSLELLAKQFYVSKYYLSHYFTKNLGVSVHQYIMKKRLEAARTAILSGEEISFVYMRLGFGDYSTFYRAFKREYGLSPRSYREIHSQKAEQ